jgi:hypothetical protein
MFRLILKENESSFQFCKQLFHFTRKKSRSGNSTNYYNNENQSTLKAILIKNLTAVDIERLTNFAS